MGDYFVIKDAVPNASGPAEDTADLAEKREMVNQRLAERRQRELGEDGGGGDAQSEAQVRAENIISEVKAMREAVKAKMFSLLKEKDSLLPVAMTEELDNVATSLSAAEKHLAQHADMLPIYEVRALQSSFKKVSEEYQAMQSDLQPKKKFGFSGRKNKKAAVSKKEQQPAKPEQGARKSVDLLSFDGYAVSDRQSETIVVGSDAVDAKDVSLRRLRGCTVHVLGSPSTLHATQLDGCTIVCGPVATSVFVDECKETVFALACQQLRVHSTKQTSFFLHVTSRAIIEDCAEVKFGPYSVQYERLDDDYRKAGLDRESNNWKEIDDFNWLARDKASPNWSLLPEEEWRTFKI